MFTKGIRKTIRSVTLTVRGTDWNHVEEEIQHFYLEVPELCGSGHKNPPGMGTGLNIFLGIPPWIYTLFVTRPVKESKGKELRGNRTVIRFFKFDFAFTKSQNRYFHEA